MPFVQAKCPECGGMLAVDADKKAAVCQFCGEAFIVQEAINNYNTYNTTNYNTTYQYGDGAVVNVYEDKNKNFIIEAGVLKEYHGADVDVVIPDNVIKISAKCFYNLPIRKVSFPNSLSEIQGSAFSCCDNLTEIVIPSSVKIIGPCIFNNCTHLKQIVLPNSITEISSCAFQGCKNLKSVIMPDGMTKIGMSAFCDCTSLEKIAFPNSIKHIEMQAFKNCNNLKEVIFSKELTYIGANAFENCESLTNIAIPDKVIEIESGAFKNCRNLVKALLPSNLEKIESFTFSDCHSLTYIEIPTSVKIIEKYAFSKTDIKKLILPKNVIKIGDSAFYNCKSLKELAVLSGNIEISNSAFSSCERIEKVQIDCMIKVEQENGLFRNMHLFEDCKKIKSISITGSGAYNNALFPNDLNLEELSFSDNIIEIHSFNGEFRNLTSTTKLSISQNCKIHDFEFSKYWETQNLCRCCGDEFNYFKRCKNCGRKKDY